eukprot:10545206-Alexandrium_andersonii.AAC.1
MSLALVLIGCCAVHVVATLGTVEALRGRVRCACSLTLWCVVMVACLCVDPPCAVGAASVRCCQRWATAALQHWLASRHSFALHQQPS